ncbi:MAG TPA: hypothetical protein VFP72_12990, partial [Kineosporiaceae bacterium]|nr:hypothetical protein [Kineosporiaceae bacterium]
MEDPSTRPPAYGPAHRARSRRQEGWDEPRGSRLRRGTALAVPTAVLVVVGTVLTGGATAAVRGGQPGFFGGVRHRSAQTGMPNTGAQNSAAQGNGSQNDGMQGNAMQGNGMQGNSMQGARPPGMIPLMAVDHPMPAPRLRGRAARNLQAQQQAPAAAAAAQAAAAVNMDCTLIVPANPTTAQGLSTPYQLVATNPAAGPCHEANALQSAFVQGAIVTADGQITLYDPLVIDQGTQPLTAPAPAQVPAGATVAVWFGFNGNNLTLAGAAGTNALAQGNCVNGLPASIFGQFGYCNAPAFFQVANAAIAANTLQVPAVGTARDGLPCPTVRDFSVVDQDQSDNVDSHYLTDAQGRTGLANAATRAALQQLGQNNVVDLFNGSDNRLLDFFINPALGCTAWSRPNGAMDGMASFSLPLNELQAAANQQAPVALVPLNDPMVLNNNNASPRKDNLFRRGVTQPLIGQGADNGNGTTYCRNLFTSPMGIQRVFRDQNIFVNGASPDPAAAVNLFAFLAMRGQASFTNLGCGDLLRMANPITLTMNNGVVTSGTFAGPAAAANGQAQTGQTQNGQTQTGQTQNDGQPQNGQTAPTTTMPPGTAAG